jgi:hypothetical protein
LQWLLPVAAYGTTAIYKDWEGTKQYTYSLGTTVIVTSLLKDTAEKMRTSSASNLSFPSGHTSAAFSAAAFVDTRYGHAQDGHRQEALPESVNHGSWKLIFIATNTA